MLKISPPLVAVVLLFLAPLIPAWSVIAELITNPSDMSVLFGFAGIVAMLCWLYLGFAVARRVA